LRIVAKYYGKNFAIERLRQQAQYSKEGVSLLGIANAAESVGFKTLAAQITSKQLLDDASLPAILHWEQNHFVVIVPGSKKNKIIIADPGKKHIITLSQKEFNEKWLSHANEAGATGIALLLEPGPSFNEQPEDSNKTIGWKMLLGLLQQQRKLIFQLFLGLVVGSILQLIFPFLTQSIVDTGINTQNIHFIYIILLAQGMLVFSRTIVEFIRSRVLLHISTKINISLLSSFWMKLMRLPISYFDTKKTGDIQQRLMDQKRIESFLTGTALSTFFSLFNLLVFSIVLLQYNSMVFFIFAAGSVLYLFWIRVFLRFRRTIDYNRFSISAKENTATMQLIYGMQEIKLNNAEQLRRWEWEGLQAGLFNLQFKSLALSQWQQAGGFFINEGKNILITFFAARAVIEGQITLGGMLAIQYIIGQLNSPIEQMVGFSQQFQDAKLSLERLNELQEVPDEEPLEKQYIQRLPQNKDIEISSLEFTYPGAGNEPVLKDIHLKIPHGKTTAIVGMSGSGKTTIIKLLLGFYKNYSGKIMLGETAMGNISPKAWRANCGSVMQDGFIFNDSIARNIAVSDLVPNIEKLVEAAKLANIIDFIESMPLGFNTKIGAEGNGISAGQKQRLLIARAIYKDPEFLFFDEATNALDATNEKQITANLEQYFNNRTVVIVAHRLSTVMNAHKIVLLHKGCIAEEGTHHELTSLKGRYYELVRNQLELGN
jgi:ATP-binding cassette subfamily B protein